MPFWRQVLFIFFVFFVALATAAWADKSIGIVLSAEGEVYVVRPSAKGGDARSPLAVKDPLYVMDTVTTGAGAKLQILLNDDSSVTVASDSTLELSDFSDDESNPRFGAKLEGGLIRILTGEITEKNPAGFKVTTAHATVGIRGTSLSVGTDENRTVVSVYNSPRLVVVNGVDVAEHFKITVELGGRQELTPLSPEEEDAGKISGVPAGSGSSLGGGNWAGLTSTPEPTFNLEPDPGIAMPAAGMASVSSLPGVETSRPEYSGLAFGFDVDLSNGAISNGFMTGTYASEGESWSMALEGGTGLARPSGFSVDGIAGRFRHTGGSLVNPPSIAASGSLRGNTDLATVVDGGTFPVTGSVTVDPAAPQGYIRDEPNLSGHGQINY
jgi:hypothetical protein